jgi:hypothetical protein
VGRARLRKKEGRKEGRRFVQFMHQRPQRLQDFHTHPQDHTLSYNARTTHKQPPIQHTTCNTTLFFILFTCVQIGILQLTPWYPLGQQCAVATAAAEAAAAGVGIDVKRSWVAAAAAGARDVPFWRQL